MLYQDTKFKARDLIPLKGMYERMWRTLPAHETEYWQECLTEMDRNRIRDTDALFTIYPFLTF